MHAAYKSAIVQQELSASTHEDMSSYNGNDCPFLR